MKGKLIVSLLLCLLAAAVFAETDQERTHGSEEQLLREALAGLAAGSFREGEAARAVDGPELARLAEKVRKRRLRASGLPPASGLVLVMIDTLRADHLGGYGHHLRTSPFLDRLASRGIQLEYCFSSSPWTRPSMASVLTGTFSGRHRVFREKWDKLPQEALQLSEILQACGFTTLGVNANPILGAWFGFDQGFDRYLDSDFLWKWMKGTLGDRGSGQRAPWDAEQVNRQAETLVATLSGERPFFLQAVYLDVHTPRKPPGEYQRQFSGPRYLALYDASILYVDRFIQRLQASLRQAGRGDVWFVVFADHGEGLNSDNILVSNRGHGYDLYDSLIRVPVLLYHPGLYGRLYGRRLSAHVSSVDLAPTLLHLLGLPHDLPCFEGQSLVPRLLAADHATEEPIFSETQWRGVSRCAVRLGGWKLILHERLRRGCSHPSIKPGGVELYRVDGRAGEGDPAREDSAGNAKQVRRLRQILDTWRQVNRPGQKGPEEEEAPDRRTREALKALGYLE